MTHEEIVRTLTPAQVAEGVVEQWRNSACHVLTDDETLTTLIECVVARMRQEQPCQCAACENGITCGELSAKLDAQTAVVLAAQEWRKTRALYVSQRKYGATNITRFLDAMTALERAVDALYPDRAPEPNTWEYRLREGQE